MQNVQYSKWQTKIEISSTYSNKDIMCEGQKGPTFTDLANISMRDKRPRVYPIHTYSCKSQVVYEEHMSYILIV